MVLKSRLEWKNEDWANYLDCPVQKISEFKKILDENYVMAVERNAASKLYSFAVYRYDVAPSGAKRLQLLLTDDKHKFANIQDAMHDANNIISSLELNDYCAKALNVPKRAIQMMLIREK